MGAAADRLPQLVRLMFGNATIEKRIVCRTVGELREALADQSDETPICGDLEDAIELTFQRNRKNPDETCVGFAECDPDEE